MQGIADRKRYLADHDGDRQKIDRIDTLLSNRVQNSVADAMIDTPEYLQDLIGDYRSSKHKGRWIDAATKVEDYRHRHGITDLGSAFGAEPGEPNGTAGQPLMTRRSQRLNHRRSRVDCECDEQSADQCVRPLRPLK